jgi:hypothetical protein
MKVHANAALGPAGRLALVEPIRSGVTAPGKCARGAGSTIPLAPTAAHDCSMPTPSTRSASGGNAPAGGRSWLPARSAAATRPSGRCWRAMGSHGRRRRRGRRHDATSGLSRRSPPHGHFALRAFGHAVTGDRSPRSRKWMDPRYPRRL